ARGWPPPRPPRSAHLEARLAFAEEGSDALLAVLAGEDRGEGLLLGLDPGVELYGRRDALDRRCRERRLPGELARPHQRRVEELVVFDQAVGEPQLEGFVGEDG